jgi:hypothetical protein
MRIKLNDRDLGSADFVLLLGLLLITIGVVGLGWQAACVWAGGLVSAAAIFFWDTAWPSSNPSEQSSEPPSPDSQIDR